MQKKYVLFHKVTRCNSLSLQLQTKTFNNIKIKRENYVKFLGVMINENLTQKNHIEVIENKISENIVLNSKNRVLYRASHLLDFKNLKIYFSFIHIYISYANIAWASTFKTKLQGILKKKKHAERITFHAKRFDHSRPLLNKMKVLNVFLNQLNSNSKIYAQN